MIISARTCGSVVAHGPDSAARAAPTAWSTSAFPALGTSAITLPVVGSVTSKVFPLAASVQRPPMNIFRAGFLRTDSRIAGGSSVGVTCTRCPPVDSANDSI